MPLLAYFYYFISSNVYYFYGIIKNVFSETLNLRERWYLNDSKRCEIINSVASPGVKC
jgi:hypothetical protein